MAETSESTNLTGKLLIAMPGMSDPRFERSVIYLCAHSSDGSMGLIVNKPVPELKLDSLLAQLGISAGEPTQDLSTNFGGPVESGRGFVLHSDDYFVEGVTMKLDGGFGMTASIDILEAIAEGTGPDISLLMLGYAGWGPGQIESEIVHNGWLVADADPDLVFDADNAGKWTAALKTLGIDPITLSAASGRA